jgi:hypothetical protein
VEEEGPRRAGGGSDAASRRRPSRRVLHLLHPCHRRQTPPPPLFSVSSTSALPSLFLSRASKVLDEMLWMLFLSISSMQRGGRTLSPPLLAWFVTQYLLYAAK